MANQKYKKLIVYIFLVFLLFFVTIVFIFGGKGQGIRHRIILASPSGKVAYLIFDYKKALIYNISLPPGALVSASKGLGEWKTESLWKLAEMENEKPGEYIKRSLIRGIGMPIDDFVEADINIDTYSIIRLLLGKENKVKNKFSLIVLALRSQIQSVQKFPIGADLARFTGEEVPSIEEGIVELVDATGGDSELTSFINLLVGNLGGKIIDIKKDPPQDFYCKIVGKNVLAEKLNNSLECEYEVGDKNVIYLGKKFISF